MLAARIWLPVVKVLPPARLAFSASAAVARLSFGRLGAFRTRGLGQDLAVEDRHSALRLHASLHCRSKWLRAARSPVRLVTCVSVMLPVMVPTIGLLKVFVPVQCCPHPAGSSSTK